MDQKFRDFLTTEYQMGKVRIAPIDLLLLGATLLFGILLRSKLYPILAPREPGLPSIFGTGIMAMKYFSTALDYLMAVCGGVLVLRLTESKLRGFLTLTLLFLSPAVVSDSALWGMADSLYLALCLLAILMAETGRAACAGILLGIASFFSPYAAFILPAVCGRIMAGDRGKRGKLLAAAALLYTGGGVLLHTFMLELKTADIPPFSLERILAASRSERLLSYHVPGIYAMIGEGIYVSEYTLAGYMLGLTAAMLLFYLSLKICSGRSLRMGLGRMSLLCALVLPFILPGMNERCLLLAAVCCVVLAMCEPAFYQVAVLETIIAFLPTAAYFREESFLPMSYIALAQLVLILLYYQRITERTERK